MLGFTYARKQERDQALEVLAELEERSRRGVRCSYAMAIVHAGLGDREATMTSLERAVDGDQSQIMAWIPNTPELALVYDHPRYARLVKALNLSRGRELPAAHGVADSS